MPLLSLEVNPIDRPWLDRSLDRFGRKRPVVWIIKNIRELQLANFIYEPESGRLLDPLVGFSKTLGRRDELREFLDDWFNCIKLEEDKHD